MNFQNKQIFIAFSSFLKRLVQAFQYLGFTTDLQSTTLIRKAKEKTPHHSFCLNELSSETTLVDFQLWLELQAQIYDKVSRESNQRILNSLLILSTRKTCKSSHTLAASQCQSTAHQPKTVENIGTFRLSKNNRQLHKTFRIKLLRQNDLVRSANKNATLPHALSISCAYQVIDTTLSAKNNLCTNCLSNKHHKQSCPSQKRCQVCSGFRHTTLHDPAKQIKRPTAAFLLKFFLVAIQQLRLVVKLQVNFQIHHNRKIKHKAPNSRYGQTFNNQSQQKVQRRNLNGNTINQSFSMNQCSETKKNWYEQLQLIPVSFLNGDKAFDTYALIDPGIQFNFVLDARAEFLELPRETQQSVPLQFHNTKNSMSLSKSVEPVTINPYRSTEISFEISRTFSIPERRSCKNF